ncbi:MAG: ISNCY-like element ISAtsp9 family transposase, partial [Acetobacteraceae bacterium]
MEPEFIVPQDGHEKHDCESRAMQRWLAAHDACCARLRPVYLGDDLYWRQPTCQPVLDAAAHFIFVCKPASHPTIEECRTGIELAELTTRAKLRGTSGRHRYRWLSDVPLRDGDDVPKVNRFAIEILDPAG